jgi:hypothetical protein
MVSVSLLLTTPLISATVRRSLISGSIVESGEDAIIIIWIDTSAAAII